MAVIAGRRQAREHALQILFQLDLTHEDPLTALELHWHARENELEIPLKEFAESIVTGTVADAIRIDDLIRSCSENWRLERMATVDRNVIRMAVFELLHERSTPAAVVIDEAIEVAKKFGGEESGQFVNGVLDAVRKNLESARGV